MKLSNQTHTSDPGHIQLMITNRNVGLSSIFFPPVLFFLVCGWSVSRRLVILVHREADRLFHRVATCGWYSLRMNLYSRTLCSEQTPPGWVQGRRWWMNCQSQTGLPVSFSSSKQYCSWAGSSHDRCLRLLPVACGARCKDSKLLLQHCLLAHHHVPLWRK